MSAEVPEAASAEEQKEMEDKVTNPEKAKEAKLKARYPHLGQKPGTKAWFRFFKETIAERAKVF